MRAAPLLSRMLAVLVAVGLLGVGWWFVQSLLAPAQVPTSSPAGRAAVRFDAKVDVSQRPAFNALRPLVTGPLEVGTAGRLNPFLPPSAAERAAVGAAGAAVSATSSASVPPASASTGTAPAVVPAASGMPIAPSGTLPTP